MSSVEVQAEAALPVAGLRTRGRTRVRVYRYDGAELVIALFHRRPSTSDRPLVRIHSQCLTGDALGSSRCDCGAQLQASLDAILAEPWGILLYVPSHEGRGIGIADKIRAYALQDRGLDTVEANLALGLPVDSRRYDSPVAVLEDMRVRRARLLTNNPEKLEALLAAGIDVVRVPMRAFVTAENRDYLATKERSMGHDFPDLHRPLPVEVVAAQDGHRVLEPARDGDPNQRGGERWRARSSAI
jgi:GTP cyclohydrolase II